MVLGQVLSLYLRPFSLFRPVSISLLQRRRNKPRAILSFRANRLETSALFWSVHSPLNQSSKEKHATQIALTRVAIRFHPEEESRMQVDLTFTKLGSSVFNEKRIVYIEVDDVNGNNYIRRPLPHVDFRELAARNVENVSRSAAGASATSQQVHCEIMDSKFGSRLEVR